MYTSDPNMRYLHAVLYPSIGLSPPILPFDIIEEKFQIPYAEGIIEVELQTENDVLLSFTIQKIPSKTDSK
jgi:hypothetical protein